MRDTSRMNRLKPAKPLPVVLAVVMAAGAALDFARSGRPGGLLSVPGFWSVFGLLGCFILACVCKLAARLFLKRPENYYDDAL